MDGPFHRSQRAALPLGYRISRLWKGQKDLAGESQQRLAAYSAMRRR